ncbi:MAG: hypothetical protein BGP23_14135 [Lysobacterales bacterium 66-474]|nr:MAG: hypothetical protein ABT18_09875 [Rhodanobacter sp. SCN 66-43]OJY83769.1 MAG: hypothetical protein BGP23_14135 [Xanthomonadales bacterium 66-474]
MPASAARALAGFKREVTSMNATILNFPVHPIDISLEAARCGIDCQVAATPRVWLSLKPDPKERGLDRRWRGFHDLLRAGRLTACVVGDYVLVDFATAH